jgi:lipoyl(octanoyl) transferase
VTARWRLLYTEPLDGIDNMALDHALLARAARTGESVLRVYSWQSPTVSFGRHQHTAGTYDRCRLARLGLAAVRRPTGGRAVLHAREATYSVTAPIAGPLRATYASINATLLAALRRLGVDASLAPRSRAPRPDVSPCFALPTEGEITVAGRKLAGSAQCRENGAYLQHGSILIEDDQALLGRLTEDQSLTGRPGTAEKNFVGAVPAPPATLREALGRAPSVEEIADALFKSLDAEASPLSLEDTVRADLGAFRARYSDEHWTWRA